MIFYNYEYPSEVCKYCPCTDYGHEPCGTHTPNGYQDCEGIACDEAYDNYVKETGDNTPIEELF